MNERLKTHSKTQKKSADLVSNKLRIGVFQRYQMKCKSVSKKSPRYKTSLKFKLALLQALPAVIEKSVEPMKSIDGIKIIQVDGLNRGGTAGDANTGNVGGGNLAEQALSAALSYRTQAPLIDSLLNEIGVSGGSLAALTSLLTPTTPVAENVE